MWESIMKFFRKVAKKEDHVLNSKDAAKERLHLVLMQDRANVSADFLELMKQEIIEVIKKYIDVDENAIDVRLTNKDNGDGTKGAPALYANIPIINLKDEMRGNIKNTTEEVKEVPEKKEEAKVEENIAQEDVENKDNIATTGSEEKNEKTEEIIHEEQQANEEQETVAAQNAEN